MRKAFLALAVVGSVLFMGTSAHATTQAGVTIFAAGLNNGSAGFGAAAWSAEPLTDPMNHQIAPDCTFLINGVGNTVTLTIIANATAGAHAVAVSTGIYCEIRNQAGTVVHSAALALPGVHAAVVSTSPLITNNGPHTVCFRGTGQWTDTHLHSTPLYCQSPNLPIVSSSS